MLISSWPMNITMTVMAKSEVRDQKSERGVEESRRRGPSRGRDGVKLQPREQDQASRSIWTSNPRTCKVNSCKVLIQSKSRKLEEEGREQNAWRFRRTQVLLPEVIYSTVGIMKVTSSLWSHVAASYALIENDSAQ